MNAHNIAEEYFILLLMRKGKMYAANLSQNCKENATLGNNILF